MHNRKPALGQFIGMMIFFVAGGQLAVMGYLAAGSRHAPLFWSAVITTALTVGSGVYLIATWPERAVTPPEDTCDH